MLGSSFSSLFGAAVAVDICTLSLHDALPIYEPGKCCRCRSDRMNNIYIHHGDKDGKWKRTEEHTSELQSRGHIVCRRLLENKNQSGIGVGHRSNLALPKQIVKQSNDRDYLAK